MHCQQVLATAFTKGFQLVSTQVIRREAVPMAMLLLCPYRNCSVRSEAVEQRVVALGVCPPLLTILDTPRWPNCLRDCAAGLLQSLSERWDNVQAMGGLRCWPSPTLLFPSFCLLRCPANKSGACMEACKSLGMVGQLGALAACRHEALSCMWTNLGISILCVRTCQTSPFRLRLSSLPSIYAFGLSLRLTTIWHLTPSMVVYSCHVLVSPATSCIAQAVCTSNADSDSQQTAPTGAEGCQRPGAHCFQGPLLLPQLQQDSAGHQSRNCPVWRGSRPHW